MLKSARLILMTSAQNCSAVSSALPKKPTSIAFSGIYAIAMKAGSRNPPQRTQRKRRGDPMRDRGDPCHRRSCITC